MGVYYPAARANLLYSLHEMHLTFETFETELAEQKSGRERNLLKFSNPRVRPRRAAEFIRPISKMIGLINTGTERNMDASATAAAVAKPRGTEHTPEIYYLYFGIWVISNKYSEIKKSHQ